MINPEVIEEIADKAEEVKLWNIVVHNDNVNTFQHVIETLMSVCGHTSEQAEQCSIIIHFKGKCEVKRGEYLDLLPICEGLLDKRLTAEIV
jgi:ATP-dependent Clp protease adaptor protein ClpS